MTCVSRSVFRISLLFLKLFVFSQTLAKPGNNVHATVTKQCHVNVYNGCCAGPEKKIETILQEMKKQLTQLQDDINILKGNKTTVKGKNGICVRYLCSAYFPRLLGCVTSEPLVAESFFSYDCETRNFCFFLDSFISPFSLPY